MNEIEKKKKKKTKNLVIGILIIIVGVLLFLRISSFGNSSVGMTTEEKIWFTIVAILTAGVIFGYAKLPRKIRRYTTAWIRQFFSHIVWPSLFLIIILMGAVTEKYPPNYNIPHTDATGKIISNSTAPFEINVNKSFSMMGNTLAKAFQRVVMIFYDLGRAHPNFWIFMIVMFIAISVVLMIDSVKEDVYSDMNAQEIIDSISEKDYKELQEYEDLERDKYYGKGRYYLKMGLDKWLLIFLIVFTAVIGLILWFI